VIRVVDAIRGVIDEFKEQAPTELKVSIYDDISFYVKRRLNVLKNNGIYGVFFCSNMPHAFFAAFGRLGNRVWDPFHDFSSDHGYVSFGPYH